jgi:6-pyruvoyltetrahydropterin/6-carboxytetrahydropterin synthase
MMIARSLSDPHFGPAAGRYGATYVVDVEFRSEHLNSKSVVVDIGATGEYVEQVRKSLNFRNLEDDPRFTGQLTTTEFLARHIHDEVARRFMTEFQSEVEVTLHESHVAYASYSDIVG